MSMGVGADVFMELVGDEAFLSRQYEVLAGRLPRSADELVFIVSKRNEVSDVMLYTLGADTVFLIAFAVAVKRDLGINISVFRLPYLCHVYGDSIDVDLIFKILYLNIFIGPL